MNSLSSHSASAYNLSLVTPGVSSTIEIRLLTNILNRVDFPTLGLPTMATIGLLIFAPTLNDLFHREIVLLRRNSAFYYSYLLPNLLRPLILPVHRGQCR